MKQRLCTIKNRNHNRGSSLITVLVVVVVLMVIVLSVLALSYQYYIMEANGIYRQKCQEIAYSMSQELQSEIAGKKYSTYTEQAASDNELWLYLRESIAQDSEIMNAWPYYMSSDTELQATSGENTFPYSVDSWKKADSLDDAKRYFKLQPTNAADSFLNEELPVTSVCMYWEPGEYTDQVEGILLHVTVSCQMGDYTYTIRDVYSLKTDKYGDSGTEPSVKETVNGVTGAKIYKYQGWEWSYEGEE